MSAEPFRQLALHTPPGQTIEVSSSEALTVADHQAIREAVSGSSFNSGVLSQAVEVAHKTGMAVSIVEEFEITVEE